MIGLLDVIDNFDRALQTRLNPEEASQEEVTNFVQGIEMIYKLFQDILQKFGVTTMDAVGKPFDPELHEAVLCETTDTYPDQTVIDEFQKGYLLNGKVIRYSTVKVSSQP